MDTSDYIGNFIEEKCPECGSSLLGNRMGDKWCSFIECEYGYDDDMKALTAISKATRERDDVHSTRT